MTVVHTYFYIVKTKDSGLHFIGAVLAHGMSVCPP